MKLNNAARQPNNRSTFQILAQGKDTQIAKQTSFPMEIEKLKLPVRKNFQPLVDSVRPQLHDGSFPTFTSKSELIPVTDPKTVASVLWQIWKARNGFIFRGDRLDAIRVVDVAIAIARSTLSSYRRSTRTGLSPRTGRQQFDLGKLWRPPDPGFQRLCRIIGSASGSSSPSPPPFTICWRKVDNEIV